MPHVAGSILKREAPGTRDSGDSVSAPWQHAAVFLVAGLLIVSHRPDAVLNPQFWAEDGAAWYADAHNQSWWNALFEPAGGYLNVFPKLAAALAQALPLAAAPLFFNLIAIFVQALPVNFFLSSRFASVGTLPSRLLLGFLYLALPNSSDMGANLTHAHWHLALLMCLLLLAAPAGSLGWRCFDLAIVLLGSLTGPFVVMLWPLAAAVWGWKRRERWTLVLLSTMAVCGLLQVGTLLRAGSAARVPGTLGASPLLFAKIVATQVFLAALIGRNSLPYRHSYWIHAVVIAVAGFAVFAYALWRGRWELKVLVIFAIVMLVATLLSPLAPPPKWPILLGAWGVRYWFVPMLAFVATLVWMAGAQRPRAVRLIATAALVLMTVGIVRDWRHPRFVDLHFGEYARQFSELPKGSSLTIPVNPPGWYMTLVKK